MDKEIQMFAKNRILMVLAVLGLSLTACKGEDTFNRDSNPVKGYDSVLQNSRPYNESNVQQQKAALDQIQKQAGKTCEVPFTLTVDGEQGKTISFSEEQSKTITLHVASRVDAGQAWNVKMVAGPSSASFTQVSKNDTEAVYKFAWTPEKGTSSAPDGNFLTLRYEWPIEARCASLPITDTLTFDVKKSDSLTVTFPSLRQDTVKFGDNFKFQIQIVDSSANSANAADVSFIANAKEDGILNAKKAVDCESTGNVVQTDDKQNATVFNCSFDTRLLNDKDVKANSGSGKTVDAVFTVKATSKKLTSTAAARVHVLFEKIVKSQGAKS